MRRIRRVLQGRVDSRSTENRQQEVLADWGSSKEAPDPTIESSQHDDKRDPLLQGAATRSAVNWALNSQRPTLSIGELFLRDRGAPELSATMFVEETAFDVSANLRHDCTNIEAKSLAVVIPTNHYTYFPSPLQWSHLRQRSMGSSALSILSVDDFSIGSYVAHVTRGLGQVEKPPREESGVARRIHVRFNNDAATLYRYDDMSLAEGNLLPKKEEERWISTSLCHDRFYRAVTTSRFRNVFVVESKASCSRQEWPWTQRECSIFSTIRSF